MRNFISIIVALAIVVVTPRDRREAATLAMRCGAFLIQLGVLLDDPGYDAGPRDDEPEMPNQDAVYEATGYLMRVAASAR